jgi:hypothetical protein
MVAAAVLATTVVAAYSVLLLTAAGAVSPGGVLRGPGAVLDSVTRVVFDPPLFGGPEARAELRLVGGSALSADGPGAAHAVALGRLGGPARIDSALRLTNTASDARDLRVDVVGAPGLEARFAETGHATVRLAAGDTATVELDSSARHAGPIDATLRVSVRGGATLTLPITGAQAPAASAAVDAQPRAGGAVRLAWEPSPSTGVAGYAVFRSRPGGAAERLPGLVSDLRSLDTTASDGQTYEYTVRAVASGVQPALLGPATDPARATSDASAPAAPVAVDVPDVPKRRADAVPVSAVLPASTGRRDRVVLSLSDGQRAVSAEVAGGRKRIAATLDASSLADGQLTVTATMRDRLGNAATYTAPVKPRKDTVAPAAPGAARVAARPTATINIASEHDVRVTVDGAERGGRLGVRLEAKGKSVVATAPARAGGVVVDASALPDGPVALSAWVEDAVGNRSAAVTGDEAHKDTVAPAPLTATIPATDENRAGFVSAATADAVTVALDAAAPIEPDAEVAVTAAEQPLALAAGTEGTTAVGDLAALPDGPLPIVVSVTDPAGNTTVTETVVEKDAAAPAAPSEVSTAAGAGTTAGYVSAASADDATLVLEFDQPTTADDTVTLRLAGQELVATGGERVVRFDDVDASELPDGALPVAGTITDAAGNQTPYTGEIVKDTVAPPAAKPPMVVDEDGDRDTVIQPWQADCVTARAVLPEREEDTVVTAGLTTGDVTAAASTDPDGRVVEIGCIDATELPAGRAEVWVTVTDAAGNDVTTAGSPVVVRNP